MSKSRSEEVHGRLGHPVIDSDGHFAEVMPVFFDYLKTVGGPKLLERFHREFLSPTSCMVANMNSMYRWHRMSSQERRADAAPRPPFYGSPTRNTLDRATAMLPRLMYERLGEMGLDFTVLYPGMGLFLGHHDDAELRRASCRAFNIYVAELFRDYADRITPAAVIPMHQPGEAIEELEFAITTLGLKAAMLAGHVVRPIESVARRVPREISRYAYWIDNLALDSAYDYDPVWAKCVELKVAATFHSSSYGWAHRSTGNYQYNQLGNFAETGHITCKALFFAGVTRRFPKLKFAFLECGAAWASALLSDLVGRWGKRNRDAIENYNPAHINHKLLSDLCRQYGDQKIIEKLPDLMKMEAHLQEQLEDPETLDEFQRCGIRRAEDVVDLFVPHFFFGCEGDDPTLGCAFSQKLNPYGARLGALLSSDISHWDVPDMREVLHEAYELVEKGAIDKSDFRDFAFTNPVRLWAGMNPEFFKGTAVESAVQKYLDSTAAAR
jgi:predicted TIM-barrel fold metal-dependent hydrolase